MNPMPSVQMSGQSKLIDRLLKSAESRYAPDIRNWNPNTCVESHMRIAADGRWFHRGSEIKRREMVKLFAAILRREDKDHYLVTPMEKARVEVEDTPLLTVDFEADGTGDAMRVIVRSNLDDWLPIRSANQLFMRPFAESGGACPCVDFRAGVLGRFTRAAHFRFAELLLEKDGWLGVWSYGTFHALEPCVTYLDSSAPPHLPAPPN